MPTVKLLLAAGAAAVVLAVSGCAGGTPKPNASPTRTVTQTVTATATATVTATATRATGRPSGSETANAAGFPAGYPKVVAVSSLPAAVRADYRSSGYAKAVAVAPGVWTPLPPGATMGDALASGILDGYCASIKAYERQYTPGEQHGGICW